MPSEYSPEQKLGLLRDSRMAKNIEGDFIFTQWERDFLSSCHDQWLIKQSISPKQAAIVEKLWGKMRFEEPDFASDDDEAEESENPAPPLPAQFLRNTRTYKEDDDDIPF